MNFLRRLKFNLSYFGKAPWDSGISPPELYDFIATHPAARAIDIGCGSGTNRPLPFGAIGTPNGVAPAGWPKGIVWPGWPNACARWWRISPSCSTNMGAKTSV